jgi:hypothetical protein
MALLYRHNTWTSTMQRCTQHTCLFGARKLIFGGYHFYVCIYVSMYVLSSEKEGISRLVSKESAWCE